MNSGAGPSPGFQPLAHAGIHFNEGDAIPPSRNNQRMMERIRATVEDPAWPPMPTMSQVEDIGDKGQSAREVQVLPRMPRAKKVESQTGSHDTVPVLPGVFQGRLLPMQFTCPCCSTILTINDPGTYRGQPGPCPSCQALVTPPRVVSPFSVVSAQEFTGQTQLYQPPN